MKRIWQTKVQKWDSPKAEDINTEFNKWVQEWSNSKQLTFPRWYNHESCDRVELHVSDAIPNLELIASVAANRIKDIILKEHRISFASVYLWSDSTTVLHWLRSSDKKQPTFVAYRLAEILDSSTVD